MIHLSSFPVGDTNPQHIARNGGDKTQLIIVRDNIQNEVELVSLKTNNLSSEDDNLGVKTRNRLGNPSIFVKAFQAIRAYPARPNFNYYDQIEKRVIKPQVMLNAHLRCSNEVDKLPREITQKDKTIKFDKSYPDFFKKNHEVFGYNLYLEENISKNASATEMEKPKITFFENMVKNRKTISKFTYLRIP